VPGRSILAVKNVTVSEDFFQGHFPGAPLMPGVLMIESLTQVATLLLLAGGREPAGRAWLRAVERAKFRRQVVPGDRLQLQVTLGRRRGPIARAAAVATVAGEVVAECDLVMAVESARPKVDGAPIVHETAIIDPGARLGEGTVIGPFATIGPNVTIGQRCRVGASAVIDSTTEIGDDTEIYPFASIGLAPRASSSRATDTPVIGRHSVFREFVTIHRGHGRASGGLTSIGDNNLFMAYAHVASRRQPHDLRQRRGRSAATSRSRTTPRSVPIPACTSSAASGSARSSAATVVTRDAAVRKTVGNRARIYGELDRAGAAGVQLRAHLEAAAGLPPSAPTQPSRALRAHRARPDAARPEVSYLVNFITSAKARRHPASRRAGQLDEPVDVDRLTGRADRVDRRQRHLSLPRPACRAHARS
jgi:3-hydroxymyristoyl/3-hydroxydecanoyl-(acyl carrier protein) dehydratase/acetyltransferase-like isoleucine patch superfamily enzyme